MARREWAEQLYEKAQRLKEPDDQFSRLPDYLVLRLLKTEHARAVRIVKRHLKMVMLDRHVFTAPTRKYLIAMLREVLADLTKGRA